MENAEPTIADEAVPEAPAAASELAAAPDEEAPTAPGPSPKPAPKPRGRPQGAKDRQPRTRRPVIRVEPLPAPVEPPTVSRSKPSVECAAATATPVEAAPPEPEPPSPRTLYRETSQRLVHLRGLMDESRRAAAVVKYTSRLYTWTA